MKNQRTKIIVKSKDSETELMASDSVNAKVVKTIRENGGRHVRNGVYYIEDATPVIRRYTNLTLR